MSGERKVLCSRVRLKFLKPIAQAQSPLAQMRAVAGLISFVFQCGNCLIICSKREKTALKNSPFQ